jgi:hypothetical protein
MCLLTQACVDKENNKEPLPVLDMPTVPNQSPVSIVSAAAAHMENVNRIAIRRDTSWDDIGRERNIMSTNVLLIMKRCLQNVLRCQQWQAHAS